VCLPPTTRDCFPRRSLPLFFRAPQGHPDTPTTLLARRVGGKRKGKHGGPRRLDVGRGVVAGEAAHAAASLQPQPDLSVLPFFAPCANWALQHRRTMMLGLASAVHRAHARENAVRAGFDDNETIFGRILQGQVPAEIIYEDELVLAFLDINPASTLHAQIIPKQRIRNADALTSADIPLLDHMVRVAGQIAAANDVADFDAARCNGTLSLGFHLPPFRTVDHLHMHYIWPMEKRSCIARIKHPHPDVFWKISPETAKLNALARNQSSRES